MPRLVQLYIRQVLFGFALSAAFVALLLWLNVANLAHLVSTSDMGLLAVLMLFVFNGIVFAGVQFAISIMGMEEQQPPAGRGRRQAHNLAAQPAPAKASSR